MIDRKFRRNLIHSKLKDPALSKNLMPKFALFIAAELELALIALRPDHHDHLHAVSNLARTARHLHVRGEARDVRDVENVELLQLGFVECEGVHLDEIS
jgi:hypothetical protein